MAGTSENLLGFGYAGFSLTMTIGRFVGDGLNRRFGAWQIIIGAFVISLLGLTVVLSNHAWYSILGFVILGAGFSVLVPEVYRLAANSKDVEPAVGIAFMAGAAQIGFLGGPAALGAIAEIYGLVVSFKVVIVLVFVGLLFSIKGYLSRHTMS